MSSPDPPQSSRSARRRRLRSAPFLLYTLLMPKYDFSTVVSSTTAIMTTTHNWVSREYITPPVDHGIYKLIGRVAAEWSRLEHALDRIIWTLAETLYPDGACITSQLSATSRYKVICAQLSLRTTQDSQFRRYIPRITTLMQKSYEPQEKRNRIIHDAWYLDAEEKAPGQFRSWPHKNPEFGVRAVDLDGIEQTIADATQLAEKAEALFEEIKPLVGCSPRP
jgi:hypothetical protein